jgi:isochorismate synthase
LDADLASLLTARLPDAPISLVIEAPVAEVEAFLRLPLPGEPLLWDGSCWGASAVAARGVVARWAPGDEGVAAMARSASALLAQAEVRSLAGEPGGPRCYGGLAFEPASRSPAWAGFDGGSFVLPRFVYERTGARASLRLNALPGEPLAPLLDALQSARRHLTSSPPSSSPPGARARLVNDAAEAYRKVVAAAVDAIEAGAFEKVVAARAIDLAVEALDPWALLHRLRGEHLVRFAFGRGDAIFLGATPERLVALDGREVLTEALAGSIAALPGASQELLASDKDHREHQVVVAEILRSLDPFCSALLAPPTPSIRALRHLLHLVTPIRGEARGALHVLDLVGALQPTPAVCGLPREAAASWLRAHEGLDRGWYAGPVGWFDGQGRGAFAVALRSALLRGSSARLFVGAGLVRGSTPEGELRETALKARSLLDALGVRP